jgi:hypothetical protein
MTYPKRIVVWLTGTLLWLLIGLAAFGGTVNVEWEPPADPDLAGLDGGCRGSLRLRALATAQATGAGQVGTAGRKQQGKAHRGDAGRHRSERRTGRGSMRHGSAPVRIGRAERGRDPKGPRESTHMMATEGKRYLPLNEKLFFAPVRRPCHGPARRHHDDARH